MRILFFNLGTIEHRVLSWEIDGFKTLFEQDIILWGPIPESHFEYNGREIPLLRIFEETSVYNLFNRLPEGWYPDIVTCDTSAINYVPDIWKCPVKTIIFTRDSWSDTVFNKGLVEFFDFVNSSTIDRSGYKAFNVNILPLRGFAVSTPATQTVNAGFSQRDIDILAIANYDNSFYHKRHKTFYRLYEALGRRYNIRFLRSIKRSEIYNYYQRSRIVIDWAHTLSNRSYEAALNGCLLFSHEDNSVTREFWEPWQEYIPYNEDTLPSLITRYLDNPQLSETVTVRSREKIMSMPHTWGEMAWDRISRAYETETGITDRINFNLSISPSRLSHRTATPFLYNYEYRKEFPSNWKELYFHRINEAIRLAVSLEEIVPPLIEASRMAFLLAMYEVATRYLSRLEENLPGYAWIYYLRARIALGREDNESAHENIGRVLACLETSPGLVQKYIMPVIEKGNACDGRRVTDYIWQSVYNHNNEYQVKSLYHLAYELEGYIYENEGQKTQAVESYISAVENISIPDCIHRVGPLMIETGEYEKLVEITAKGHDDSPYDSIVVLYNAYGLLASGNRKLAAMALGRHVTALTGFRGIRQIFLIRLIITVIIPVLFLSMKIAGWMLLKLIRSIKSKSGFIYLAYR